MLGTIGEIRLFGGNFAPRTWAYCQGQLLAISSNTALFSIIGTTYGGDGRTTFKLPDLRGRTAVGTGTGPGLTTRVLGNTFGTEEDTITHNEMAAHTHIASFGPGTSATVAIPAVADSANISDPTGHILATGEDTGGNEVKTYSADPADSNLAHFTAPVSATVEINNSTGTAAAVDNMQPSIVIDYIICMQGVYPSRS